MKITTKVRTKKLKCLKCKKTTGRVKFYLLPDAEKVQPYHASCMLALSTKQK